ncbi:hypothetical protein [Streptomyces sp. WMMC940]|uniref:hypothetical protein n=1 Tax=Streptomyces sp. WMMC940 TaxID=3015153 RepID=UPI0022B723F0|nr:hypothetical protein [Streptomyces sp. WMMC940]MCZ7459029.1 hypothetical protein [Streptomyces sp. WMMC940]
MRFLSCCAAVFLLMVVGVMGVVGASAAGLTGVSGVFTARECHLEPSGRGGESTSCSGVFLAHDGSLTDLDARLSWPGGRAGRETEVRTVVLGGYQQHGFGEVVMISGITGVVGAVSLVCGVAGLSPRARERLADALGGVGGRRGRRSPRWCGA